MECKRCGNPFKQLVRGIVICGSCLADFMQWKREETDKQFRKLYGELKMGIVEEAQRKVEIRREITIEQWLSREKKE